jgi:hypothetical protein
MIPLTFPNLPNLKPVSFQENEILYIAATKQYKNKDNSIHPFPRQCYHTKTFFSFHPTAL